MVDFFGSSHWKIPGTNGNSEKVVPFSRLGLSEWKTFTIYKFLEFRTTVKPLLSGHLPDLPKCPLSLIEVVKIAQFMFVNDQLSTVTLYCDKVACC